MDVQKNTHPVNCKMSTPSLLEQTVFEHKTNVSNWLNFCIFITVLKNGCLNVLSTLLYNNNKTAIFIGMNKKIYCNFVIVI